MNAEPDVIRRLRSAAESISVELPSAETSIHAGRRKAATRLTGLVAVVLLVAAGTTWAVTALGGLQSQTRPAASFDPTHTRLFRSRGWDVPLPQGWLGRTAEPGDFDEVVFSTSRVALDALSPICGRDDPGCPAREADVQRTDAFVEATIFSKPCGTGTPQPLPPVLRLADLQAAGRIKGRPVLQLDRCTDDITEVLVRAWIGPDAGNATRRAAAFVLGNLHLPGQQFDEADAQPFDVPYSGNSVPIPNGWAALSAGMDDASGFVLGLVASTDHDGVRRTHPCEQGPLCGITGFDVRLSQPTDAMVEVTLDTRPCFGCSPSADELPDHIDASSFEKEGALNGAPVFGLRGTGRGGVVYLITFWTGPEASAATREATLFLVANLHIPTTPTSGGR